MLPKSGVWQILRQHALDTVPAGTSLSYPTPNNLDDWLIRGTFTVFSATNKQFIIHSASTDIGAAMLADASYHLDHAVEHSTAMRHLLASGDWHSSAWSVVSIYYWAFYSVLALTRMLGRTNIFIIPITAATLKTLAPMVTQTPNAGTYKIECGNSISAFQREVLLKKSSQSRVHDAVWQFWFSELRKIIGSVSSGKSEKLESRLYNAQIESANILGDSWPSDLRNLVNYVPGLGYGTIRGKTPAAAFAGITVDETINIEQQIENLEKAVASLSPHILLKDQIRPSVTVLIRICFLLDSIAHSLMNEINSRRGMDQRWQHARNRFIRTQHKRYSIHGWPSEDSFSF